MARTQIRTANIEDGGVRRDDLNTATTGQAVVRKLVQGTNIVLTSTGVDAGTGDVTIALANALSLSGAITATDGVTVNGSNPSADTYFAIQKNGKLRWKLIGNGAETGSNTGTPFILQGLDDNGTYLGNWLTIVRATGQTTHAATSVAADNSDKGVVILNDAGVLGANAGDCSGNMLTMRGMVNGTAVGLHVYNRRMGAGTTWGASATRIASRLDAYAQNHEYSNYEWIEFNHYGGPSIDLGIRTNAYTVRITNGVLYVSGRLETTETITGTGKLTMNGEASNTPPGLYLYEGPSSTGYWLGVDTSGMVSFGVDPTGMDNTGVAALPLRFDVANSYIYSNGITTVGQVIASGVGGMVTAGYQSLTNGAFHSKAGRPSNFVPGTTYDYSAFSVEYWQTGGLKHSIRTMHDSRSGYDANNAWDFYLWTYGNETTNTGTLGTKRCFRITGDGMVDALAGYKVSGTQVITTRKTGWTAATGTATRTTFATSTVTLAQLAEHVKALVDDLLSHGLIGA